MSSTSTCLVAKMCYLNKLALFYLIFMTDFLTKELESEIFYIHQSATRVLWLRCHSSHDHSPTPPHKPDYVYRVAVFNCNAFIAFSLTQSSIISAWQDPCGTLTELEFWLSLLKDAEKLLYFWMYCWFASHLFNPFSLLDLFIIVQKLKMKVWHKLFCSCRNILRYWNALVPKMSKNQVSLRPRHHCLFFLCLFSSLLLTI